ncbi:MAG: NAD(P)/FAD-dependent oxidoreductase [Ruminococcaceae bacterium]|nr:NAD(P)/FAD-dependent oxidoreductase [Oscillospiraceae bacterium]
MDRIKIAIVGGGAAGMFCAIRCAEAGAEVTLFEKNEKLGRKLGITGKGRCNLTNNCEGTQAFLQNVPRNSRFLYTALSKLSPQDLMDWFECRGLPLKTERGNRVFPVSDRAADVVGLLWRLVEEAGCKIKHARVEEILAHNGKIKGLRADGKTYSFDKVILCTGGLSYPGTGSTGDGYRMAEKLGHTVVAPMPSLAPLCSPARYCKEMQGLALKNVELRLIHTKSGKTVFSENGEMLFTHFGLSGPLVLSASAHIEDQPQNYEIEIDLKPALDLQTLDRRLVSDLAKYKNKAFRNCLSDLLPSGMIPVMVALSGIDPEKQANSITKKEREALCKLFKAFPVPLSAFRPIAEAIVTRGGVSVSEVNPKTMESKLVQNLHFAGEVLDLDAYTGGFNLHIAFSTATVAADAATDEF